jgi:hypothetical protein
MKMPQIDTRLDEFGIVQVEIKLTKTEEYEKHLEAWEGFVESTNDIASLAKQYPDACGMRCAVVKEDGQQLDERNLVDRVSWWVEAGEEVDLVEQYVKNIVRFLGTNGDFNSGDLLNDGIYPVGCHAVCGLIYENPKHLFLATDYILYYPTHFKIANHFENILHEKGWEDGLLYMIARLWNRDADLEECIRHNEIHRGVGDRYDADTRESREKIIFEYYLPYSYLKTQIIENGVKRIQMTPPSDWEIASLVALIFPRSNMHKQVAYQDRIHRWLENNKPSTCEKNTRGEAAP